MGLEKIMRAGETLYFGGVKPLELVVLFKFLVGVMEISGRLCMVLFSNLAKASKCWGGLIGPS